MKKWINIRIKFAEENFIGERTPDQKNEEKKLRRRILWERELLKSDRMDSCWFQLTCRNQFLGQSSQPLNFLNSCLCIWGCFANNPYLRLWVGAYLSLFIFYCDRVHIYHEIRSALATSYQSSWEKHFQTKMLHFLTDASDFKICASL